MTSLNYDFIYYSGKNLPINSKKSQETVNLTKERPKTC
jgi:hypothetical protein